jgi:hypothetical protein
MDTLKVKTHSSWAILIDFPLQHNLQQRASLLGYAFIACLVLTTLGRYEGSNGCFSFKIKLSSLYCKVDAQIAKLNSYYLQFLGSGSSVGVATDYVVDGPGIEFRWGRDFSHTSRPALGPTQPPI